MGSQLIIKSLELHTATASKRYDFSRGVTAITGPIGSGKSSLFELLKYGLGGRAKAMPAIRDNVKKVIIEITVGDSHLRLTRNFGENTIEVYDAADDVRLPDWAATNRKAMLRASQELLRLVGLPPDLRIPKSRAKPTGETVPISFFDLYRYLYLDQNFL